MRTTTFVPDRLNVGFQNKSETFSGKLAYVIYYDLSGKLRKEKSWLRLALFVYKPSIELFR